MTTWLRQLWCALGDHRGITPIRLWSVDGSHYYETEFWRCKACGKVIKP